MRSDFDLDVFPSTTFQLRDELNELDEAVTDDRLATIIVDAVL